MKDRSRTGTVGSLAVAVTIGTALWTLPSASAIIPCMSLQCPSDVVTATDLGICAALVNYSVGSVGNCSIVQTSGLPSGSEFPVGFTINGFQDQTNSSINCSFTVTVNDTEPPIITCPMPQVHQTAPGNFSYPAPEVTDNCGAVTTCTPPSGSFFPAGQTNVSCIATDGSNNSASCAFPELIVGPPAAPAAGPFGLLALAVALGALGIWTARRRLG